MHGCLKAYKTTPGANIKVELGARTRKKLAEPSFSGSDVITMYLAARAHGAQAIGGCGHTSSMKLGERNKSRASGDRAHTLTGK